MTNITINNAKNNIANKPIKLNNGNLVLHYDKNDKPINAYIVTSFRGSSETNSYCSLINLDTGYIQFEERCSRNTTVQRVLSHLYPGDYEGKNAVAEGQYVKVIPVNKWKLNIEFSEEDAQ